MLPTNQRIKNCVGILLCVTCIATAMFAQGVQLRSRVELVVVPVSVKDRNGSLAVGLTQADFTITESGKRQTITNFSIEPVPISAAVLIDADLSESALNDVKNSFPALIGAFSDDDELAIYRFDRHVEKILDFTADKIQIERALRRLTDLAPSTSSVSSGPFTSVGPIINGAPIIPGVQAAGRTSAPPTKVLNDAIFEAGEDVATRSVDRRRAIFIVSDGRNQNSQHSYDSVIDRLLMHEVQVFTFGVDTSLFQRLRSNLKSYAGETGGESCFSDSQNALESCYFVSTENARNQYVLGYESSNKRPASGTVFREIKVSVMQSGAEVHHRKGYYQSP